MSATADAYDREEAAAPIQFGARRCADCEQLRLLEADDRCHSCLTFRSVLPVARQPRPEFRIRYQDWKGDTIQSDLSDYRRVEQIVAWHPSSKVSRINLDGSESPLIV